VNCGVRRMCCLKVQCGGVNVNKNVKKVHGVKKRETVSVTVR
jgi:hypothetical protein